MSWYSFKPLSGFSGVSRPHFVQLLFDTFLNSFKNFLPCRGTVLISLSRLPSMPRLSFEPLIRLFWYVLITVLSHCQDFSRHAKTKFYPLAKTYSACLDTFLISLRISPHVETQFWISIKTFSACQDTVLNPDKTLSTCHDTVLSHCQDFSRLFMTEFQLPFKISFGSPGVNFTNIFWAAFMPKSFRQIN